MNNNEGGYLLVNVRYANSALPIDQATIEVTDGINTRRYETGENGKSENIILNVGNNNSVVIRANNFLEKRIDNIPIRKGFVSIQNVEMFPAI